MKSLHRSLNAIASVATALLSSAALCAEGAGSAPGSTEGSAAKNPSETRGPQIEEVIITARKVEESEQVVPVTVTVLSATSLENRAVLSVLDLQSTVPGLNISPTAQGGAPVFAMRGAITSGGTTTVAVYIDDVPVHSTLSVANMVYDMQSITMLKGPQGTLFGANSTGGAIIFRPNKPSNVFEGYAEVGFGNYNRQSFQGMVNVPVNDVLQVRIAGETVNRDGFEKNKQSPNGSPFNGNTQYDNDKHDSLRLSARLKPATDWQNDLLIDYFHKDQQPNQAIPVAYRPRYSYATFLGFSVPVDYAKAGIPLGNVDSRSFSLSPDPTWDRATLWGAEDTLTHEIGDNASIKNVLAYRSDKTDSSEQNGGGTNVAVDGRTTHDTDQWTDEFSLDVSSEDKRLRNKTGLYFSRLKDGNGTSYHVIGLPFDTSGLTPTQQFLVNGYYPLLSSAFYETEFRSHAIYNQIAYDLTRELTASLGLRYTWDTGSYTAHNRTAFKIAPAFGGNGSLGPWGSFFFGTCSAGLASYRNFNAAACTGQQSIDSKAPSFDFNIEDHFAEKSMVFAKLSSGYLVGGFNNQVYTPGGIGQTFKPEKVVAFETGVKSDWELWDHPIRTNFSVFYDDYSDQQRSINGITSTGTTFVAVQNAGASAAYGLDLDVTYFLTDNLDVNVAWDHIDARYTNYLAALSIPGVVGSIDLADHPIARTPDDVVTASATVKWPLSSEYGKLSSTLTYYWTAETKSGDTPVVIGTVGANGLLASVSADFTQYSRLPAYDLVNFTTAWKGIMGSKFDADFWVRNLMDKKYLYTVLNQMPQFGFVSNTYGNPREIGLNLRYNF